MRSAGASNERDTAFWTGRRTSPATRREQQETGEHPQIGDRVDARPRRKPVRLTSQARAPNPTTRPTAEMPHALQDVALGFVAELVSDHEQRLLLVRRPATCRRERPVSSRRAPRHMRSQPSTGDSRRQPGHHRPRHPPRSREIGSPAREPGSSSGVNRLNSGAITTGKRNTNSAVNAVKPAAPHSHHSRGCHAHDAEECNRGDRRDHHRDP